MLLGLLIGAVMGLTGAGGGILAVPALFVGMGWTMQQAAPVALIAVAGGAALGAYEGFRRSLVRYRAAILMALAGVPLSSVGIKLAHMLSQHWLTGIFAALLTLVSLRLLLADGAAASEGNQMSRHGRIDPRTGRFHWTWGTGALLAAIGAVTGFLSGLLGVGGGFVIVPMLHRFTNVSMHGIVATSLFVTAMIGSGGVLISLARGAQLPLEVTALFTVATAAGMLIGRRLSRHVSELVVQRGFATLVALVAIGLWIRTVNIS